jgi:hypothetical protein
MSAIASRDSMSLVQGVLLWQAGEGTVVAGATEEVAQRLSDAGLARPHLPLAKTGP